MSKRVRKSGGQIDQGSIGAIEHSLQAGAHKTIPAGWSRTSYLGDTSTAKAILKGTNVAIYNNSGSTAFVSFYPAGSAVAANATAGVPVPPNNYVYLNSGDNDFIISSAATVLAYTMQDETNYVTTEQ